MKEGFIMLYVLTDYNKYPVKTQKFNCIEDLRDEFTMIFSSIVFRLNPDEPDDSYIMLQEDYDEDEPTKVEFDFHSDTQLSDTLNTLMDVALDKTGKTDLNDQIIALSNVKIEIRQQTDRDIYLTQANLDQILDDLIIEKRTTHIIEYAKLEDIDTEYIEKSPNAEWLDLMASSTIETEIPNESQTTYNLRPRGKSEYLFTNLTNAELEHVLISKIKYQEQEKSKNEK